MEIFECTSTSTNLVSAASRLTHGAAGSFDIDMPLAGTSGVEDRDGAGSFLAVFTFDTAVTSGQAKVVGGTGMAGAPTFSGNEMRVPLTGVTDVQIVTVRVRNVNGGDGSNDVPFGFLIGDVNGNRVVDIPDKNQVNADKGQTVTSTNFRDDINLSGKVNKPDLNAVNAEQEPQHPVTGLRHIRLRESSHPTPGRLARRTHERRASGEDAGCPFCLPNRMN